jgi:guanosine-diphosphatase
MLPRANDTRYKRLEVMDKDAAGPRGSRVRFGWKKFAIGAAVIIGLVWLFGPRERRESIVGSIKTPSECDTAIGGL